MEIIELLEIIAETIKIIDAVAKNPAAQDLIERIERYKDAHTATVISTPAYPHE